jgi:hypothetical protein
LNRTRLFPCPSKFGTNVATPDANKGWAKLRFVGSLMPAGPCSPRPLHYCPMISWTVAPDGIANVRTAMPAVARINANCKEPLGRMHLLTR